MTASAISSEIDIVDGLFFFLGALNTSILLPIELLMRHDVDVNHRPVGNPKRKV
jgi:hypothetical protein